MVTRTVFLLNAESWASEIVQWDKALTAKPDDLSFMPRTCMVEEKTKKTLSDLCMCHDTHITYHTAHPHMPGGGH